MKINLININRVYLLLLLSSISIIIDRLVIFNYSSLLVYDETRQERVLL